MIGAEAGAEAAIDDSKSAQVRMSRAHDVDKRGPTQAKTMAKTMTQAKAKTHLKMKMKMKIGGKQTGLLTFGAV